MNYTRKRGPTRSLSRKKRGSLGRQYYVGSSSRTTISRGRYANQGELKFHDFDFDDAIIAVGGTVEPSINIIPQGVLENNRIGRKCTIKKIFWKYETQMPATVNMATATDVVRIILYLDKQANGATAAVLDILETANYQSFRNLSNVGRFQVLMDKTVMVTGWGGSNASSEETAPQFKQFKYSKSCNIPLEYDNSVSTGALTSIRSNNIGALLISRGGVVGFRSKFRLRFSDN